MQKQRFESATHIICHACHLRRRYYEICPQCVTGVEVEGMMNDIRQEKQWLKTRVVELEAQNELLRQQLQAQEQH
jgi:hypothetical protein